MNGNCSTTGCKNPERLPDAAALERQWKSIDWKKAEAEVNRLQARIAKATQENKWNTVKRLQYLLTHSYYAKVLAVRKVTTNKGKKTPGVDGVLWSTPAAKMRGVLTLTDKGYKAKPLRRVSAYQRQSLTCPCSLCLFSPLGTLHSAFPYCLCSGQQRTIHFPDTACRSYSVCRNSFSYWNYIYGGLRSLRHKK